MNSPKCALDRREFAIASLAAAGFAATGSLLQAAPDARPRNRYCASIKYLKSLSYAEVAEAIAAAGFGGVEVTVRSADGYILPEKAAQELPKFKQALDERGLEITILTTDILRVDQPYADSVLRTAADLGLPRYRLGFYRYDLKQPIVPQLDAVRPAVDALAALNRKLGIAAVYQNHSGADFVGATIWDLHSLLKDHPVEEIGCVWDLRHAATEAGEAWPTMYELMKPHISAMSVKDFIWKGRLSEHAPLGEGLVDPQFYTSLAHSDFAGPISVHVEYLENGDAAANLAAIKKDFATLKKWMGA